MRRSSRYLVIGAITTGIVAAAAVWWVVGGHEDVIDDVLGADRAVRTRRSVSSEGGG